MTLHEAISILINDEHIGDFVYNIRDRTDTSFDISWNHPRVKRYSAAVHRLEQELTSETRMNDIPSFNTSGRAWGAIIQSGRYWTVSYDELTTHCREREDYHKQRELHYRNKADALDAEAKKQMSDLEGDDALEAKLSNSYGKRSNERESARESSRHHAKLALRFQWLGTHLIINQSIQLTLNDAIALELVL